MSRKKRKERWTLVWRGRKGEGSKEGEITRKKIRCQREMKIKEEDADWKGG